MLCECCKAPPQILLPRICLYAGVLRHNWHRQRPTQKCLWLGLLWMQHEKKLISHIADRLWGKATSIELVCMRGGKLKYGLGSQMPASSIGCFGYGGWNVLSVCMCVSACDWCRQRWHRIVFCCSCTKLFSNNKLGARVTQMKWMF